ncbi:DUF924 family protein [Agaribacterium sp. ZY112]|uniref:DUF924 family protein n=1 Tax=Agaribacterium sp. ZY112 TaxID=3233574 RepID=UPI003523E157
MSYKDVINFWFSELELKQWWQKDAELDLLIANRFMAVHKQARSCELYLWRRSPEGRLAEIIVLDQFSRNIFRDQAEAFSCDALALVLAQEAVTLGVDKELPPIQRSFLYMPYMHSESVVIHEQAMSLFSSKGMENNLDFEVRHKEIIDRFGRYPHRNPVLGRQSSPEELLFLEQPGSSF